VRGKVTLDCQYITDLDGGDFYPAGAQLYGYYVRAGEGVVHSPARRFIGAASPDGIAAGVPHIVGGVTQVIHTFDGSRFDELGLQITATDHLSLSSVGLAFVDENMVPVGPGGVILVTAGVYAPFAVGDYLIESVFGGYPNLKYLIAAVSGGGADVSIHGYFTRR
jgi:hypothetical protein